MLWLVILLLAAVLHESSAAEPCLTYEECMKKWDETSCAEHCSRQGAKLYKPYCAKEYFFSLCYECACA